MEKIKITNYLFAASMVSLLFGVAVCLLALRRGDSDAAGFGWALMASSLVYMLIDFLFNKDEQK